MEKYSGIKLLNPATKSHNFWYDWWSRYRNQNCYSYSTDYSVLFV